MRTFASRRNDSESVWLQVSTKFAMILFNLRCADDHRFEAWFRNGEAYEAQATAGEIICPVCAATDISKAPMAPRIAKGGSRAGLADDGAPPERQEAAEPEQSEAASSSSEEMAVAGKVRETLTALRRHVEANADYVGSAFAEEARKIHYGEADERSIYGESSAEETEALNEEGVPFSRIPWVPKHDS